MTSPQWVYADRKSYRANNTFLNSLQKRQEGPSTPPIRLSQLNYAMLKESALRKKLQDIGIPSWGSKDLMKRRHVEWLNIFNSNCDAHESVRKSKAQLLRELDEWENTQGGKADNRESKIMKKNFDGNGHMKSHKSDFDDLIAKARQKRTPQKAEEEQAQQTVAGVAQEHIQRQQQTQDIEPQFKHEVEPQFRHQYQNHQEPYLQPTTQYTYQWAEPAHTVIRGGLPSQNEASMNMLPSISAPLVSGFDPSPNQGFVIQNPSYGPIGRVPMFEVPDQPVKDRDNSSAAP